jgi:hypothetical protein
MPRNARELAHELYQWALTNGVIQDTEADPTQERRPLATVIHPDNDAEQFTEADRVLDKVEITGILVNDADNVVTVLTKGRLGPRTSRPLPIASDGVTLEWIGSAYIDETFPPKLLPAPGFPKRCYLHNERIACGSSVTAAPLVGAGTLGALVRDADGTLCGLSNNHVTGGCNHIPVGMPVISPAPIDASPEAIAPLSIGRHTSFLPLLSGNPGQVVLQQFDASAFRIVTPNSVSSMQGENYYDTPPNVGPIAGGQLVKKVGRSTGLTHGRVVGEFTTPLPIPYASPRFSATVYFTGIYGVVSEGQVFSGPGDSGSLVASEDGTRAVGLVFGSMNNQVSLVIPLQPLFNEMRLTIVSGYNV